MPDQVLIVEDDAGVRRMLERSLGAEGFEVRSAPDGGAALALAEVSAPDLVVLDVAMPGLDGFDVCRRLREKGMTGGVLMLTARDAVPDRVSGLRAGADDYLVKPFAFDELLARVEALLRRSRPARSAATPPVLRFEDLVLDPGSRTARRGERDLHLTPREFDLLAFLLRHPNQVLARATLMSRVWGDDFYGDSNVLEVFVGSLRRTLEEAGEPRLIQTVRGVGYVLRRGA